MLLTLTRWPVLLLLSLLARSQAHDISNSNSHFGVRPPAASPDANAWLATLPFGPYGGGGLVQEPGGKGTLTGQSYSTATLHGSNREYLVNDTSQHSWAQVRYRHLNLLGKTLTFTVDVSGVGCGCNAALYLVGMKQPMGGASGYCDIQVQGGGACIELDLLEANRKAVQSTVHTQTGEGVGPCNQWGCAVNWGSKAATGAYYGQGSPGIDSTKPFTVMATFDTDGHLAISFTQAGRSVPFWNSTSAQSGSQGGHYIEAAAAATKAAMQSHGLVLVTSLWSAKGGGSTCHASASCQRVHVHVHVHLFVHVLVLRGVPCAQASAVWPDARPAGLLDPPSVSGTLSRPRPPVLPPNPHPRSVLARWWLQLGLSSLPD